MSKSLLFSLMISTFALNAGAEELGRSIPISARLKRTIGSCKIVQFTDFMACPKAEKLSFSTDADLQKFLGVDGPYRLTRASAQQAFRLLQSSMEGQTDLAELLPELESEDREIARSEADSISSVLPRLQTYINESSARGMEFYIDEDTQWERNASGRAVLLVNRAQKTITIILHGDVNG